MGGFYTIYFSTHLIVFNDQLKSWAIGQTTLLFSFIRNTTLSFFKNLTNIVSVSPSLGIHLKPQGV